MEVLYHGSDYLFSKFLFKNVGKKSGTSGGGFGIYLTNSKVDAAAYGKYVYTVNAQLKKSISNDKITLSKVMVTNILQKFEELSENSYIENWGENFTVNKAVTNLLKFNDSDVDIVNDIINATGSPLVMVQVLKYFGISHAIDKHTAEDKTILNYVIYDLDCLQIVKREKLIDDLTESIIEIFEEAVDIQDELENELLQSQEANVVRNKLPMKPGVASPYTTMGNTTQEYSEERVVPDTPYPQSSGEIGTIRGKKTPEELGSNLDESAYEESDMLFALRDLPNAMARQTQIQKSKTLTLTQAQGRARSKSQRRLMAMALAYKRGKLPAKYASETIKKLSKSIDQDILHDFAATNQKKRKKDGSVGKRNNIPEYVKGSKYAKKK